MPRPGPQTQAPQQPIEVLISEVMVACRRRTGRDPEGFAALLNAKSERRPNVIGGAVRAWESAIHPPPADLFGLALVVAGADAASVFAYALGLVTGP